MIKNGMECLHLVLKKKWFIEIAEGRKKIEYRDATPYWNRRLDGKGVEWILFQYAYHKPTTYMIVECVSKEVKGGRWELGLGEIVFMQNLHINELNPTNVLIKDGTKLYG